MSKNTNDKNNTDNNGTAKRNDDRDQEVIIDLRSPGTAAMLAWLIPGAGHLYQRRTGKGILFMVCILSTYFFGLAMGDGRVVYASFRKNDIRWQYVCQIGVGLPALPALIQSEKVIREGKEPPFGKFMAPPRDVDLNQSDELSMWHLDLKWKFEMATLYTMIAGLLNILAIYDAYAGPMVAAADDRNQSGSRDPGATGSGTGASDSRAAKSEPARPDASTPSSKA